MTANSSYDGGVGDVARIQLLLDSLFLAGDVHPDGILGGAPLEWVTEWLRLDPSSHFGKPALRHLVAIQLAPRNAIDYDYADPVPRWKLIADYLGHRFGLTEGERTRMGRLVASVLDDASRGRGPQYLAADGARQCALCRLPFRSQPISVLTMDPYKPIWRAPKELGRPEVDHIVAISTVGTHSAENLQVICRACNLAKGAGLIVDPDVEVRFAGRLPADVPRIHLFRLLQWLIVRHDGECETCGKHEGELTMRLVHPAAALSRANLALRCYMCV